jgi:hypothetical protein
MLSGQTKRTSSKCSRTSIPGIAVGGYNIISQADTANSIAIHLILLLVPLTTILQFLNESAEALPLNPDFDLKCHKMEFSVH